MNQQEEGILVRIEVEDTGIGIPEEGLAKIFKSFQQVDDSTTRKYGGTGLGLAISTGLIELMNGEIGVDSIPGKGSTFWFTVPLQKGELILDKVIPPITLSKRRVLVVDDQPYACQILSELLRDWDMRVDALDNGADAVLAVKAADDCGDPYELILLDWHMPGQDGLATSRQIKVLPLTSIPPRIMITAYNKTQLIREAKTAGFKTVLIKPVAPRILLDNITLALVGEKVNQANHNLPPTTFDATVLKGLRILVAEDNIFNQQVAQEVLEDVGVIVALASNGEEAVEMAQLSLFDGVLMDLQMPKVDGLEATRQIQAIPSLANLPIIAMTANATSEERDRCLSNGMIGFITKPVQPETLYKKLAELLIPEKKPVDRLVTKGDSLLPEGNEAEIDFDVLGAMFQQNFERMAKYIRRFIETADETLVSMDLALENADFFALGTLGHTLKSVAQTVGAMPFGEACRELESFKSGGELERAQALVKGLHERLARIRVISDKKFT